MVPFRYAFLLVFSLGATACMPPAVEKSSSSSSGSAETDGGMGSEDGGASSGSSSSSGGPAYGAVCDDPGMTDIFSPLGTPSLPADKGRLLGCVTARSFTQAELAADDWVELGGVTALGGAEEYVIQYASEGPDGVARRVTGLVLIPTGIEPPYPVVSFNHGTSGFGPLCGVTRDRFFADYLMLPLVARGYAVVATDYANLGVPDGVSPYAVGEGTAHNVLDALRAARDLDGQSGGAARLGNELFITGHSQGGHAALWAHQLFETEPVEGMTLLGSIPIAPAFGIPYGVGQAVSGNGATDLFTAFALVVFYAHGYDAQIDPTTWLQPDPVAEYESLANSMCSGELYNTIQARWPTREALFQDSFRNGAATCSFDGTACPQFEPWATAIYASTPGYFESQVPILMVAGGMDDVVTEFSIACIQAALRNRDNSVRTCRYGAADHIDVGNYALADMLEWMEARRAGMNPDVCEAEVTVFCPAG